MFFPGHHIYLQFAGFNNHSGNLGGRCIGLEPTIRLPEGQAMHHRIVFPAQRSDRSAFNNLRLWQPPSSKAMDWRN